MPLSKEVLDQIQELSNDNAVAMVEVLLRIAKSTHEPADARLGAAQVILEIARGGAAIFDGMVPDEPSKQDDARQLSEAELQEIARSGLKEG